MMWQRVGVWAPGAGAGAFAVFWESSVFWDDKLLGVAVPWMIRLAVHGVAIILIVGGLIARYWLPTGSGSAGTRERVAAAIAIVGGITVLPLFFAGMALLGLAIGLSRRRWAVGAALMLGGALFIVSYGSGVRLGFEDAPPLTEFDKALAAVSIALVPLGLCTLGFGRDAPRDRPSAACQ